MESLMAIHPISGELIQVDQQSKWEEEIRPLITMSINLYNKSVQAISRDDYESSWNHIRDSISIFPFIRSTLVFGLTLALEIGEYIEAQRILQRLSKFLSQDENEQYSKLIISELATYNAIVTGNRDKASPGYSQRMVFSRLLELKELEKTGASSGSESRVARGNYVAWVVLIFVILFTPLGISKYGKLGSEKASLTLELKKLGVELQANSQDMELAEQARAAAERLNTTWNAFMVKDYKQCGKLIIMDQNLVQKLIDADSTIMKKICAGLYRQGSYNLLSQIDYPSEFHVHADFLTILDASGDTRRNLKESFVNKYATSKVYTAPLIRELFESEDEVQKRKYFAIKLQSLIILHPEDTLGFYMSSTMKNELEQEIELPTTQ